MASAAPKRKRPAFSPPRPRGSYDTSNATITNGQKAGKSRGRTSLPNKQKKARAPSSTPSTSAASEVASDSPLASPSLGSEPDFVLAEVIHENGRGTEEPSVPLSLIHRLLHHHFRDKDKTRITTDAKEVVGKYVEVFIREAIARSAFERQAKDGEDDGGGGDAAGRGDHGWLEVEDLEKMSVQLVLDF